MFEIDAVSHSASANVLYSRIEYLLSYFGIDA